MNNNTCGIYCIINLKNNNRYIGSSKNIYSRWYNHRRLLLKNKNTIYLQRAWNKYGEKNFSFIILEQCNEKNLLLREQHYIDLFKPKYNISKIAGKIEMTEEVRKKISNSSIGKKSSFKGKRHTDESKKKISDNHANFKGILGPFYGRHHTEENKKLASIRMSGKNHPFYNKKRTKHSKRMLGKNNPFYGKQHSDATKIKNSLKKSVLSKEQILTIIDLINSGISQRKIASKLNLTTSVVWRLLNNKILAYKVTKEFGNWNIKW